MAKKVAKPEAKVETVSPAEVEKKVSRKEQYEAEATIDDLSEAIFTDLAKEGINTTRRFTEKMVKAVFNKITEELVNGSPISIHQFGKFKLVDVGAKRARNLQTGEEIMVKAFRRVSFKPSINLRRKIQTPNKV